MKTFLKMLAVAGCGIVATAVLVVVAVVLDDVPNWLGLLIFFAPFAGTLVGGFLVSRGSSTGRKVAWILAGGLLIGFLVWWGELLLLFVLLDNLDDGDSGGFYCC